MKKEEKIIIYDSPEAAQLKDMKVWVSGPDAQGKSYMFQNESSARYSGCTHRPCGTCGEPAEKSYTACKSCRHKFAVERYMALPFKEWDCKEPVVTWDGDRYFFDLEDLMEYMNEAEMEDIDLKICEPIHYRPIDVENIATDTHEDMEPDDKLCAMVEDLNKYIKTLEPHSWRPGKIRTSYKLSAEDKDFEE